MKRILRHRLPGLVRRSKHPFAILCLAILLPFAFFPFPCHAQGVITTVAGSEWIFPAGPLPAANAPLGRVVGVAVDAAGNVFAADRGDKIVVKIYLTGVLNVVAGNGIVGFSGDGGPATSARLFLSDFSSGVAGVALDAAGNLYIADVSNRRIRKVSPVGIITTVAGNGRSGFSGDGGPATSAELNQPVGVAVDATGSLYIAEEFNHRIRKVSPGGIITTVAGNGVPGFSGDGGPATGASLNQPQGVAVDAAGNLYIADTLNQRIRKVSPAGIITTVAGNGNSGFSGDGGPATSASLFTPGGIAVDAFGNLYIADTRNERIRKVSPDGIITTVAGSGLPPRGGFSGDGGPATSARLDFPLGVAVDGSGNLYIADDKNRRIRKVSPSGIITTLAGSGEFKSSGDGGPATSASLGFPTGVTVDAVGNLYIADRFNHRIRRVTPGGTISTVAGDGVARFSGDGGLATSASLNTAIGVAVDAGGSLYIADEQNQRIRKVSPSGFITTAAGSAGSGFFSGDGGPATSARLRQPNGVAVDGAGNLYIADSGNRRIRKVGTDGIITTVAGNGDFGFSGDGGPATSARLDFPKGVAIDAAGNLYIADSDNHRIRKVSPDGIINTVAGSGIAGFLGGGFSGDGGPATSALLNDPTGVAVDGAGNLFIVDEGNQRIRKVSPAGIITTVAGNGNSGFSGDGGLATSASLDFHLRGGGGFRPGVGGAVAVDAAGNLYIADSWNSRIRKVLVAGAPSFSVLPTDLIFSAKAGAAAGASQQLTLSSSIAGLPWQASVVSGSSWLSVSPSSGQMPATVSVSADATSLASFTHQASIEISAPAAMPSLATILVTFTVTEALPASLAVEPSSLSFQVLAGAAAPPAQSLRIENTGGGTLNWMAEASTVSGNWLAVSATSGSVSPATPVSLQVSVNPGGLAAGSHSGSITVGSADTNQSVTVSVSLLVTAPDGVLLLSETGLLFRAVEAGGSEPPQTFGVLNVGSGSLDWTAETTASWLRVSQAAGSSNAGASEIPLATVSVDPAGLAAGFYVGLVEVRSAGANNSPQVVKVDLQVLPPGTRLGNVVRPTGMIFVAAEGSSSPGSQNVTVATTEAELVEFISVPIDAPWVKRAPDVGRATRDTPGRIVVQPELGDLTADVYRAGLTVLTRNDGELHPVNLLFLVLPPGAAASAAALSDGFVRPAQGSGECTATELVLQFTSLFANFSSEVGFPTVVLVNARDDCGNAAVGGSVVLSFSSGDPALTLTDLKNGQYVGTWRPNKAISQVVVTARGLSNGLEGEVTATAQVGPNPNPQAAILNQGGVVLGAGFTPGPLAPGSIVSLFGQNLAAGNNLASELPLPRSLGLVRVLIGGQEAPLFFAGPGQVNAQVPFELEADRQLQVLVEANEVLSAPEPLQTAANRPGIFTLGPPFGDQGAILIANTNRLAMPETPNVPSEPAEIGGFISIFCTGLGATEPAVASGDPGPAGPLATVTTPVSVTIGNQSATVSFAGLAPGFVGVYQVNAQVPAGVTPGDAVPVVLTQGGFQSNTATIAVQ